MDNIKLHNSHYSGSAQHVSTSNCHIHNIIITEHKPQPNPYNANLKPTQTVGQQSVTSTLYVQLQKALTLNLVLQWYQQARWNEFSDEGYSTGVSQLQSVPQ
jgi:hypothetical protein